MKYIFNTFLILLFYSCSFGRSSVKLIVRGDDMGFSHSGNMAIVESFRNGIVTTIEVIVPSPWFPETVRMLKDFRGGSYSFDQ